MESELYKVTKKDLPKLQALLNKCFASDPLYETLIPNEDIRKKLLPKLFACDMEEFYKNCDIFADSPDLNGLWSSPTRPSRTISSNTTLRSWKRNCRRTHG